MFLKKLDNNMAFSGSIFFETITQFMSLIWISKLLGLAETFFPAQSTPDQIKDYIQQTITQFKKELNKPVTRIFLHPNHMNITLPDIEVKHLEGLHEDQFICACKWKNQS